MDAHSWSSAGKFVLAYFYMPDLLADPNMRFSLQVANSILNAGELDRAVAALTYSACAVGHRGGYLECAQHVEEMLGQEFDVSHCSVTDQANAALTRAEDAYDNLTMPVMDLFMEALKKDDWCQRLKAILDPPVTVELSDEEEPAGDDGGDGDDDGNDDDGEDDGDDGDDRREEQESLLSRQLIGICAFVISLNILMYDAARLRKLLMKHFVFSVAIIALL